MKDNALRRLLLMCFFLWSVPLLAADRWYHVEIIVFEQQDTVTDEQWPEMTVRYDPRTMLNPDMNNSLIQPDKVQSLVHSARRLTRSPHYTVLYHRAWQQPVRKKRQAKPVYLLSEDHAVEGTLRLYKATYLYAAVDIWLLDNLLHADNTLTQLPDNGMIEGIRSPHLKQARRIKVKRPYFFDHPRMGILLQLTPIPAPRTVADSAKPSTSFSLPEEAAPTVQ